MDTSQTEPRHVKYTCTGAETVTMLAGMFDTTYDAVLQENPSIRDERDIHPGIVLTITPGKGYQPQDATAELTPQQKRAITYAENRKKRQAWAKENALRHKQDQELVGGAMRHILLRPDNVAPALLVFAASVLDNLDTGAHLVPYHAEKLLEHLPADIDSFKAAVKQIEAQSQERDA